MALTVEEVQSKFRYEPETGHIYWIEPGKGKIKKKPAGTKTNTGYMMIMIDKKRYYAHRLAWALYYSKWPNYQIDHINGDKVDNRINNLREATIAQNGKNYGFNKSNTSGEKGVCWSKSSNKWRSIIKVDGKQIHLGYFTDMKDAILARHKAEQKHFGEWRRA